MLNRGTFTEQNLKLNFENPIRQSILLIIITGSIFLLSSCSKMKDPAVPVIINVTPASPSFDRSPTVNGSAESDSEIALYSAANCTGTFLGRSRSDSSGLFAVTAQALIEGRYDFSVQITNSEGRSSCSDGTMIYALDMTPPTISLTAPSLSLISASSAAVNFSATYSGVLSVNLTAAHVSLNTTGTATCTSKVITAGTTLAPTVSFSNCTGNGTVGFTIIFGSAYDNVGNSAQATSGTFVVDNAAISSAVFSPATSVVGSIPTSITVTFSKPVNAMTVTAADFTVSGTCTPLPTLSVISTATATTTLALTATTCAASGQAVTLSVNLAGIQDAAGTPGVGTSSATYTLDNLGPTTATFLPITSQVRVMPASVTVTYSEAINPLSVTNADFTVSGTCTTLPTFNVSAVTSAAATLSFVGGTCTHGQTVIVTAAFAGVADTSGNFGASSGNVTYTFDTVGPVALTMSPASMATQVIQTTATINFNDSVLAASVTAGDLVVTGTCSILPNPSVLSVSGSTVNFSLSAATCTSGQTVILTLNGNVVTDAVGNAGSGSLSSTLTLDTVGPAALSISPVTAAVNAVPTSITVSFNQMLNAMSVTSSDLIISGTCTTLPAVALTSVSGMTATFSLSGTSCSNGQTATAALNGSSVTDTANNAGTGSATATYTIDSVGPTPSAITPVSATRKTMPTAVSVLFDDSIQAASVAASDLSISGTCAGLPTVSVASASGATVNFTLTGATCAHGATLILSIAGTNFNDLLSNAGSGTQSVTYMSDTVPASILSFSPATSAVLSIPFSVNVTFSESLDAASVTAADISVSGTCMTLPTASINSVTAAVITVGFSGAACAHGQYALLTINNAGISDSVGNFGTGTSSVTYTLDNLGPTVSSFTPGSGAPPTAVNITFNEAVDPASVATTDFTVSGSCMLPPTVVSVSTAGSVVTVNLSSSTCLSTMTLQIGINASLVTDFLGNVGSGTSTVIYTAP